MTTFSSLAALLLSLGAPARAQVEPFVPPSAAPSAAVGASPVPMPSGGPIEIDPAGLPDRGPDTRGPIERMWFVIDDYMDAWDARDAVQRVKDENPGVKVRIVRADEALEAKASPEGKARLAKRLSDEGIEFVLAATPKLYEPFRSLRDSGYCLALPMGFAGRRFVSVDIPRATLDPAVLSDPRSYPHRKYLELSREAAPGDPRSPKLAGMDGSRRTLSEALDAHVPMKKDPRTSRLFRLATWLSGESDPKGTADLRRKAQRFAAYLDQEKVDLLATDDPQVVRLSDRMKEEGYHLSLPVVWTGSIGSGREAAFKRAVQARRLPENFNEMGGVAPRRYEQAVRAAVERALPSGPADGGRTYQLHFLLSAGKGIRDKGDYNAHGHFAMAVEGEDKDIEAWSVQYKDEKGGTFTGGLGKGSALSLAEYLYALWFLPGATGQTLPLSQTSIGPVVSFILGGLTAPQLLAMRHAAAYINAQHLLGRDSYDFVNSGGRSNCISMVTQILRAAGFPIADSGLQSPGDKSVELMRLFARQLLTGQLRARNLGLVVFDRPPWSGGQYRIWNWPLGSPALNFKKPWAEMSWLERLSALFSRPLEFLKVPRMIAAFAGMATHRVTSSPGSRKLRIEAVPDSPLAKLREAEAAVESLAARRSELQAGLLELENEILALDGLKDWRRDRSRPAGPYRAEAQRRDALIEIHGGLDAELALNKLDEQIELRRAEFLRFQLADPLGKYARRLAPLRAAYEKALSIRDAVAAGRRLPTELEVARLGDLNAKVETSLESLRLEMLNRLGPPPPHDVRMELRQVTGEMMKDLGERPR